MAPDSLRCHHKGLERCPDTKSRLWYPSMNLPRMDFALTPSIIFNSSLETRFLLLIIQGLDEYFFLLVVKFCACYWNINNIASVCLEAGFHSSYTHSAHAPLQAACFLHQHVHFRRDPDTHPPVSPWEPGQAVRCCMWIISQENEKIFLKKKGNWPNIYNC